MNIKTKYALIPALLLGGAVFLGSCGKDTETQVKTDVVKPQITTAAAHDAPDIVTYDDKGKPIKRGFKTLDTNGGNYLSRAVLFYSGKYRLEDKVIQVDWYVVPAADMGNIAGDAGTYNNNKACRINLNADYAPRRPSNPYPAAYDYGAAKDYPNQYFPQYALNNNEYYWSRVSDVMAHEFGHCVDGVNQGYRGGVGLESLAQKYGNHYSSNNLEAYAQFYGEVLRKYCDSDNIDNVLLQPNTNSSDPIYCTRHNPDGSRTTVNVSMLDRQPQYYKQTPNDLPDSISRNIETYEPGATGHRPQNWPYYRDQPTVFPAPYTPPVKNTDPDGPDRDRH